MVFLGIYRPGATAGIMRPAYVFFFIPWNGKPASLKDASKVVNGYSFQNMQV